MGPPALGKMEQLRSFLSLSLSAPARSGPGVRHQTLGDAFGGERVDELGTSGLKEHHGHELPAFLLVSSVSQVGCW